jgi:hypothetical protein
VSDRLSDRKLASIEAVLRDSERKHPDNSMLYVMRLLFNDVTACRLGRCQSRADIVEGKGGQQAVG